MPETEPKPAPPWGADFTAEAAWTLVQDLRGEKADLQARIATARADLDAERRARTEAETGATADPRLVAAEERAAKAERSLLVERATRAHGLDDDLVEFLTGDTEDEIRVQAERLARPTTEPEPDAEATSPASAARPAAEPVFLEPAYVLELTPGHGGIPSTPFDADAIVRAARQG